MKLYSIFYKGDICGNPKTFEGVTDNFEKWLEEHNKDREEPEGADNFEVQETTLYLYNKENVDER